MTISVWATPSIVCPPITGNRNELQEELDTRKLMKDLCWFPVQSRWAVLYQKLHHFHHLLSAVVDSLVIKAKTELISSGTKAPLLTPCSIQQKKKLVTV